MMKKFLQLALLFLASTLAFGQAATVNWTNVHQEIDGLGGIDRNDLTSGQQSFVFGTGAGQLGISVLHTNVSGDPQDCTSIGTGCATVTSNMTAVLANGGKVWVDGTTPPSRYLESYTIPGCGTAGTRVIPGDFGAWATWITNYVKSLQAQGVNVYGVSVQNEPNTCGFTYYSAADFDTFIKTNLGPTFAANSISALIYFPETSGYGPSGSDGLSTFGSTCMGDSACKAYVGGIAFHDYDLTMSGFSVSAAPYPFGTQGGIKYWETEFGMFQCPPGYQTFCQPGWNVDMTIDGLQWAAILDQRLAVDGLNNWQIYLLQTYDNVDDGLINGNTGAIAKRAYVFGQYGFVRPGYYRIDATHAPQSNVTVSAYQNTGTNTLIIIATNYSGSSINQTFNVTNAPTFTSVTPTQTSTSNSLATLSSVSLSGNSFTYPLPAQSVTTFVGNSSASYTLSTATTGSGTGSISACAGSYSSGAGYSCTVTPSGGSTIASVTGCGGSGTTTYAGTMPASSCTVTATFNSGGSQLWTGLLATNRAPNNVWTSAGAGIIPARTTICTTLGTAGQVPTFAQSVTAATVESALAACPSGETVLMNPGTYTFNTTLFGPGQTVVAMPSNVTLRGSGPQQTILAWTAGSNTCLGIGITEFCALNGDSGAAVFADNILQVTAGTAQGSTSITVGTPASAGCYNNAACSGSLSNLHVGSLMQINQCDTNLSTVSCTGTNADNGNLWLCGIGPNGSTATCTWGGADNYFPNRGTNQTVLVTGITGSTVTFTPALIHPNWTQGQSPFVVFSNYAPVKAFGLENIQINTQQMGDNQTMYQCEWCYQSWVKNVAFVNNAPAGIASASRMHVTFSTGLNNTMRDSYMYGSSPASAGYGVDLSWGETSTLVENNIAHHVATAYIMENAVAPVFGYNFAVDNFYTGGGGAPQW
ncbi:MAG TPA: hypothetical protein VMR02_04550, partial [Terracidiphilus sp.]|nr:hypothetical protein [Terracidiphilus sp.]